MKQYKITADSTCDLSSDLLEKYDVSLMSLKVMLGEKEYTDRVDIEASAIFDFYNQNKQLPKTAARNQDDYKEMFQKYVDNGQKVIHFSLSSDLSMSYQSAYMAGKALNEKETNVYVIDTKALSSGSALLVLKACRLLESGMDIESVVAEIQASVDKVQTSFCVDTLEYLHKGGRCSSVALLGANMLGIHPYINMKEGKLGMYKKFRGSMARVLKKYVDTLKEEENPDSEVCFITHSSCDQAIVEEIKAYVEQVFSFKEIHVQVAGCTITAHCGKGTLGVLFMNK